MFRGYIHFNYPDQDKSLLVWYEYFKWWPAIMMIRKKQFLTQVEDAYALKAYFVVGT